MSQKRNYFVSSSVQQSKIVERKISKEKTLRDFFERLKRRLTKKFGNLFSFLKSSFSKLNSSTTFLYENMNMLCYYYGDNNRSYS